MKTQREPFIEEASQFDAGEFRAAVDTLIAEANLITTEAAHAG